MQLVCSVDGQVRLHSAAGDGVERDGGHNAAGRSAATASHLQGFPGHLHRSQHSGEELPQDDRLHGVLQGRV